MIILLCAVGISAQETKCALKIADLPDAPELLAFRMGMTSAQLKARVPQVTFPNADNFGVVKTSISPDFDPTMDKASLAGVRTVSFDFLDGRLTSLWFGYDGSFKWKTVPQFVAGISPALHLPNAWEQWKIRGQQLKCADFQMTVMVVAEGPSFHIIDESAEQTIAARRAAKEEQEAAANDEPAVGIVADVRAKVYYLEDCQPPEELGERDRLVFKTKEEAEKAGYKPAKGCE